MRKHYGNDHFANFDILRTAWFVKKCCVICFTYYSGPHSIVVKSSENNPFKNLQKISRRKLNQEHGVRNVALAFA